MKKINRLSIWLFMLVIGLSLFGVLMQYSASSYSALKDYNDSFFYVKKQLLSMVVGFVAMVVGLLIPIEFYKKYRYVILVVSYIILALVFIPGLGIEKYGAKRWLNLGITTLQPSEIAKFGLMIFISAELSATDGVTKKIAKVLVSGGIMCVLIMLQPNMSITMCVGFCMVIMLFLGGTKLKHFALMVLPLLVIFPLLIISEPYRLKRLVAFVDPWATPLGEGFQLIQSYYALGSGGLWGVGLFNSRQKYLFLPFAESDFIFSIVCEELGFIGGVCTIAVIISIIFIGYKISRNSTQRYPMLLSAGLISVIAIQSLLNIAVVTGSIPPTGVPLPFVSAGGSSLMVLMFVSGVLMNISNNYTGKASNIVKHKFVEI